MASIRACLIDVYDTILTCDFSWHRRELPKLADVEEREWLDAFMRIGPALTWGQLSQAQAVDIALRTCGVTPRPGLVRDLVDKHMELLLATSYLYGDSLPFLEELKARGIKIAIVSNCSEPTRPLLASLGVTEIADSLALSFEVGSAKPAPGIYQHALDQLGVPAEAALFVDDQTAFCAAAEFMGIGAARIIRGEGNGEPGANWQGPVVRSMADVAALLDGRGLDSKDGGETSQSVI